MSDTAERSLDGAARTEVAERARPDLQPLPRARPRLAGELAVVTILLVVYDQVRSLPDARPSVAVSHGWAILHLEQSLHLRIEHAVNAWLTGHALARVLAVGYYQFLHVGVTLAVLAACYLWRPDLYRGARNALVLTNVVGLAAFTLYPTAPPRLLPGGGYVDTVAAAGFGTDHGPIPADQYGALPSLHLAWATWAAVTGIAIVRGTPLRWALLAHPVLTGLAVVATANHYLLDVATGILLGVAALAATGMLAPAGFAVDSERRNHRPTALSLTRTAEERSPRTSYTVVAFHAHPDDETLLTGGTLARLAAEGHRVVVVVATLGEAGLTADGRHGIPLGQRRLAELRQAAAELGCGAVEWLGYSDSGLNGNAPGDRPFVRSRTDEAADRLAEILRRERADLLTIYDPVGGYGHPDHVRVHTIGRLAAQRAATPVVLEATVDRRALLRVAHLLRLVPGLPPQFRPHRLRRAFAPNSALTHRVDVRPQLAAKRAAMAAHASQRSGGSTPRSLAVYLRLPAPLFRLAFGHEWFVEHGRRPQRPLLDDVLTTLREE